MKYLSLFVFAALASWTWNIIHSSPKGPEAVPHEAIQTKMRLFIEEKVKSENANLTDFQLRSLWTEEVAKDEVKVHYSYSYANPSVEGSAQTFQSREGVVLLKQSSETTTNWNVEKQIGSTDSIEFAEALVIQPGDESAPAETPATEAPVTTPPETKH